MYGLTGSLCPNFGRKFSEATKKKIVENSSLFGVTGSAHPNFGKRHSNETKKKISEAHSGEKHYRFGLTGSSSPNAVSIIQYDKYDNQIRTWPSQIDAAIATGVNKGNISSALKGKRKTAGGYVWRYKRD